MMTQTGVQSPKLAVFSLPQLSHTSDVEVAAPCSKTASLMELFEEVTGWEARFEESKSSFKHRIQPGMETEPAQGTFSIVDMSADWPANKLTSHRGKCDQMVSLISDLVSDLQAVKLELSRTRSALAALSIEPVAGEDEILVDSFVPKYGRIEVSSVAADSDFELAEPEFEPDDSGNENEFEVRQDYSNGTLVSPPFDGWTLGGATGIVDSVYLDWLIDDKERIAISVGKIESAFGEGDAEAILKVDPVTSEYRVAATGGLESFLLWDCVTQTLQLIEPSTQWERLKVGDAIVATTDSNFEFASISQVHQPADPAKLSAGQIADWVGSQFDGSERVMVIKRD